MRRSLIADSSFVLPLLAALHECSDRIPAGIDDGKSIQNQKDITSCNLQAVVFQPSLRLYRRIVLMTTSVSRKTKKKSN